MSYYVGDYYEGDPGFFGSLGRFAKGLIRSGVRTVPGVGALVSAVGSVMKRGSAGYKRVGPTAEIVPMSTEEYLSVRAPGLAREMAAPRLAPMPGGAITIAPPTALTAPGRAGPCIRVSPRGRRIRINCRTGKAVRHMRVTNPKALRRAIRRANGFAKLARKVLHFTSPRAPRGRAVFRKRRKK